MDYNNPSLGGPRQFRKDWFIYGLDFSINALATSNQQFQVQADSDFELIKLGYTADVAGAVQTDSTRPIPLITLQIQDSGAGRNLFNVPISLASIFGNGGLPFILPIPRIFKANTTVTCTFVSYSAATNYHMNVAFIGCKVFYPG